MISDRQARELAHELIGATARHDLVGVRAGLAAIGAGGLYSNPDWPIDCARLAGHLASLGGVMARSAAEHLGSPLDEVLTAMRAADPELMG